VNIHYKHIGQQKEGTTIIFLHEGLGCGQMWRDYPQALCESVHLNGIIYDRAGYGKSPGSLVDRKADYLHLAADELRNLILDQKIEQPILYGHSDGGSIALIYASMYPDQIKAVITEAAHVFNEEETIKGVMDARPLMDAGKMEGLRKYHGDRYQEVFYAWNDIWLDESFLKWNITDSLPEITCPQLIIQGVNDQYGTLKQVESIKKLTTGYTQLLTPSNCGHAPFKEQKELVLASATKFINGII
jgi:pimeloyl-ACP methyl ester carboxylesterase